MEREEVDIAERVKTAVASYNTDNEKAGRKIAQHGSAVLELRAARGTTDAFIADVITFFKKQNIRLKYEEVRLSVDESESVSYSAVVAWFLRELVKYGGMGGVLVYCVPFLLSAFVNSSWGKSLTYPAPNESMLAT